MNRYALAFRVRPGTEQDVAELLSTYDPPKLEIDEETRLLGTAVFMKGNLVVRVMEIEGDLAKVAPHLAADPSVQAVERKLNEYLEEPVDPSDPEARRTFLAKRLMHTVLHREAPKPAAE
ncbi:hypothetical protein GCM10022403_042160 [Streptomyces coacervatus]|uniref:SchA/CurD-like domain-containing protein n=1 Tax=Streptomyces coacervatus TaxID=647381 RepID=A0ABP7I150_9ACTN|nr:SchA/CurD-like domain-containing protein [Streptomyces coacervatus]MDF2267198.1 SchA/CurD-like domain-containing protein [Streptomyces coacervatus]